MAPNKHTSASEKMYKVAEGFDTVGHRAHRAGQSTTPIDAKADVRAACETAVIHHTCSTLARCNPLTLLSQWHALSAGPPAGERDVHWRQGGGHRVRCLLLRKGRDEEWLTAAQGLGKRHVVLPPLLLPPLLLLLLLVHCPTTKSCALAPSAAGVFRSDLPCKFRCKPEAYQARGCWGRC